MIFCPEAEIGGATSVPKNEPKCERLAYAFCVWVVFGFAV